MKPHGVSAKMYRHTQVSGLISQAGLNKIASMFQSQPTAKQLGGFSVGQRGQMDSLAPLTLGRDPRGFFVSWAQFWFPSQKATSTGGSDFWSISFFTKLWTPSLSFNLKQFYIILC